VGCDVIESSSEIPMFQRNLPPLLSTLKTVTAGYFEMLITIFKATWRHTLKESNLNIHRYENIQLHNLYYSPNIFRTTKTSMMIWAGYVACMWRRGMHTGFWW
jgi:hypothetical protein